MNLAEMTVEQLKALGFDFIGQIETAQRNLIIIQEELSRRTNPIVKEVKDED